MNVRQYFEAAFPPESFPTLAASVLSMKHPNGDGETYGDILSEMPIASACGEDCIQAIAAATAFCNQINRAFGFDYLVFYRETLNTLCRVLCCYIRG